MKIIYEAKEIEIKDEANGFDLAKEVDLENKNKVVGYMVDGEIRDMRMPLPAGKEISLIYIGSKEAFSMLNHSTSHLMAQALRHLYPGCKFGFGPDIEEGYYYDVDFGDVKVTEEDFAKIEAEMKKCAKENNAFVRKDITADEARVAFAGNEYKQELIEEHKDEMLTTYTNGDFIDFCRGPHIPSTGLIKHFKILSLAGAYWRGNSNNKQLTRIYGTSWYTEEELKNHLEVLERRKLNDHRRLGKELGLFLISDYGPGFPFFLPNGMLLKNALMEYWRNLHTRYGYKFIETPTMLNKELWLTSGHWDHYKENMYTTEIDEKEFAIKPMNCPGAMIVYNNEIHSYKDLPLRLAEAGHVHRHEASGALNGLFRVRAFTQDDSHIFVRQDQIEDEVKNIMKLFDEVYTVFGLSYKIVLSTMPEDHIGSEEFWQKSEAALAEACKSSGHEYTINPGDGAFYGPKLDFKLKDSMGRTWQCGTIQLDVNLPQRFNCSYIDEHGEKVMPVMLHRVVFGSIERFIGIITENFGGAFPTFLAPTQVNLLPVNNDAHGEYAKKLNAVLASEGIRSVIDDSNEKLGYRMRQSIVKKIPFTLVLGDKEMANNQVTYRVYGQEKQVTVSFEEFKEMLHHSIKTYARY